MWASIWVLGTKLKSSASTINPFNHWTTSPVPVSTFKSLSVKIIDKLLSRLNTYFLRTIYCLWFPPLIYEVRTYGWGTLRFVLASFLDNCIQAKVIWGEGILTEKILLQYWPVGKSTRHFLDWWFYAHSITRKQIYGRLWCNKAGWSSLL